MAGYYASGGIMKRGTAKTLKASGAETVSTTHGVIDTAEAGVLFVVVDVTAHAGTTPTLTVVVEGSTDGVNWFELGVLGLNGYRAGSVGAAPSNIVAAPATVRGAFPAMQFCRTRSLVAGAGASFTYSVNVETN